VGVDGVFVYDALLILARALGSWMLVRMRKGMHVVKQTLDQGWDIDIVADRDGLQSDWNDYYFNDTVSAVRMEVA
jgi:hypothetical protein